VRLASAARATPPAKRRVNASHQPNRVKTRAGFPRMGSDRRAESTCRKDKRKPRSIARRHARRGVKACQQRNSARIAA